MNFNKEYDHIIPIGSNCRIGIALRDCKKRPHALPFDWMLSTMKSVNELFDNDFEDFMNRDVCVQKTFALKGGKKHTYVLNEKYNLNITHESSLNDKCIDKYKKRVDRMYDILKNKDNKVLFIRNTLDGVIKDELHKHYLSTEKDYSDFDPKHIERFNSIIKSKFELDYDILVINHTKSIDFSSDNIYNVTSTIEQKDNLWDQKACAEVVQKIKLKKDDNK